MAASSDVLIRCLGERMSINCCDHGVVDWEGKRVCVSSKGQGSEVKGIRDDVSVEAIDGGRVRWKGNQSNIGCYGSSTVNGMQSEYTHLTERRFNGKGIMSTLNVMGFRVSVGM